MANDNPASKPDEKPQNLLELYAAEFKMAPDELLKHSVGDFSITSLDNKKQLDKDNGLEFTNGNYNLSQHPEILKGAEEMGKDLHQIAEKQGIKIESLPEFKNADFNGDGKVDAKEIGAMLLAASLVTGTPSTYEGYQTVGDSGLRIPAMAPGTEVVSVFTNVIDAQDLNDLKNPKTADKVQEIAKQILGDNKALLGMKDIPNTDNAAADRQFLEKMKVDLPLYR